MTTDRLDLDTGELVEAVTSPVTLSPSIAQLAGALAKAQGAMTARRVRSHESAFRQSLHVAGLAVGHDSRRRSRPTA